MSAETCKEQVSDGMRFPHYHKCGRKVKEDGLCGMHLAARNRRAAKSKAYENDRRVSDQAKAEVHALLDELGIKGTPEFDLRSFRYTGRVTVSLDTLRELAAR